MPSSKSVASTLQRLTRNKPRLALGVAAASAATVASVAGVAAAGTPAAGTVAGFTAASYTRAASPASLVSPAFPAHPAVTASVQAIPAVGQSAPGALSPGVPTPAVQTVSAAAPRYVVGPAASMQAAIRSQSAVSSQHAAPGRHGAHGVHAVHAVAPAGGPARHSPAAQQSAPASPAPPPAPPQPYQFYDSVTPTAIPPGQRVATYANGPYAASPASVAGRGTVLWIDTNGSDPNASALDVEPGDATPQQAGIWAAQKLNASPNSVAIIYTMRSEWPAVQSAINALPWWMPSHVRYWIADPTGVPHIVPGSQATQWYWGQNYDISTALPGF